jgi:hypothetical protein
VNLDRLVNHLLLSRRQMIVSSSPNTKHRRNVMLGSDPPCLFLNANLVAVEQKIPTFVQKASDLFVVTRNIDSGLFCRAACATVCSIEFPCLPPGSIHHQLQKEHHGPLNPIVDGGERARVHIIPFVGK